METTLKVEGMTCGHCKQAVEGTLKALNGVTDVKVDLASGEVTVKHDDSVSLKDMQSAIEDQGYDVVA
ncbi:copper chaperone CopZ [Lentibacillus saliphilus]|uniref:copper chaperone CopZ n=1 Tax=Lentibacillus saliphilus TaxID=2737028 RepID=UPI001C2F7FE2|nr:copper chaperone CopZ [Lentibacillus saliphilus]